MLKENFKQKREELDDLLIILDMPKACWHMSHILNHKLSQLPISEERNKALIILHELNPEKLTYIIPEGELNGKEASVEI